MQIALISAVCVGGASIFGAALGVLLCRLPDRLNGAMLSFAAGVMLMASIVGLIQPSVRLGNVWLTAAGIFCGAIFLRCAYRLVPWMRGVAGMDKRRGADGALLFILAIAVHNLPEGVAAGVAAGQEDAGAALSVTLGLVIQNIPEGLIVIMPLVAVGVSKARAFALAATTGLIEIVGTILGYFAVSVAASTLPFALAFAGGAMLYVIGDEMIPESRESGVKAVSTYMLLLGFALMMVADAYAR